MSAHPTDHHPPAGTLRAVPSPRTADPIGEHLERGLLGALLLAPTGQLADQLITTLGDPAAFTRPRISELWQLAATGWAADGHADITTVHNAMRANKRPLDPVWLIECTDLDHTPPSHQHALTWATQIAEQGHRRRLTEALHLALQLTENGDGADRAFDAIDKLRAKPVAAEMVRVPTLAEDIALLAEDEVRDWVIPGMLERGDRLLLTGGEGSGKSTLLRQISVQVSSGIHPFGGDDFEPVRVLIIDVENPENIFRREIKPLWLKVAEHANPDRLRVDRALGGLNLATPEDYAWLRARIADARPDLLIIGPLYKLAGSTADSNEERDMKPVAFALDKLRAEYGFALICETHSNKMVKDGQRSMEPNGWSGWLRWPEFGYCLTPTDEFRSWRGDRSQREWPTSLRRGGAWPFSADNTVIDHRWRAIRGALGAANRRLTEREIATETGLSRTTVQRTIEARRDIYDIVWKLLPGGDADL